MRNKAPLALLEQVIMLLVFAVAAVVCLQAFVWSDVSSGQSQKQDQALILAQNVAETLKYTADPAETSRLLGGTAQNGLWVIPCADGRILRIVPGDSGLALLGTATVEVLDGETCLASVKVAWQEVDDHG